MILKKIYNLFLLAFIFFSSFNLFVSNGFAVKDNPTCEITNTNINCKSVRFSEVIKVNLFYDPYRIQIKFANKLIIKKNNIYNGQSVKKVSVNKFSKSKTKVVIELKKPTIISHIKYYKTNNQSINLSMYFSDTSEVNYAIAKHALKKNEGDIFSFRNDIKISSKNFDLPVIKKQNFNKRSIINYVVFIDP